MEADSFHVVARTAVNHILQKAAKNTETQLAFKPALVVQHSEILDDYSQKRARRTCERHGLTAPVTKS
ncbi:hypothetical protein BHYA_0090g00070 [Botrytis hyacinthi]|uniref:Uncharacterized protein n=1 Tax=Botrytis hyacinthi TaxID=278943 RepID=A0A4Z1GWJ4_9HELO|nr:hypothetical protein BHYA_0090g00070 [Botrytis hyacinthi]